MTFDISYPAEKVQYRRWMMDYSLNAYYAGKHWAKRKEDADYWHTLTAYALRNVEKERFENAEIAFLWNDGLDIDNHAVMGKMIVDALVKARIIQSDNRKHLTSVTHRFWDSGSIRVIIREAQP